MINPPKTKQEAEKIKYGAWSGNPKGYPYNPDFCAYEVPDVVRSVLFHQCCRNPGHGPDALYCRQHAKIVGDSKNG